MKPRINYCKVIFYTLLCLAPLNSRAGNAKNPPVQTGHPGESKLAGSYLRLEDILAKSDIVFVGEIERIGWPDVKEAGIDSYHGVRVKVIQTLKGSLGSEASVEIGVREGEETAPHVGTRYLFFIVKEIGWLTVRKLVVANDATIAQVKQLIAAAPVHISH